LAAATPMGRTGRRDDVGDTSVETTNSNNSGKDYFGRAGHSRGQSSGIKLPGATATASRRGGPAHPPVPGSSIAPDGSGYSPNRAPLHSPMGPGPSGYASRPNGQGPVGVEANQKGIASSVGMGPPPATDSKRRSRYARPDGRRVDSVGPGVIRKSMYLGDEGVNPQQQEGSARLPPSSMKRVESIGKGDHRRKSSYMNDPNRQRRGASLYNTSVDSQADNFGAGDPLGAEYKNLSPATLAKHVRGLSPSPGTTQQMGMPVVQRQYSNGTQGPGGMNNANAFPGGGYPRAPAGYPGGGAPRMPQNPPFAPMSNGYDRGPRQIV
jgi:hypothetical protein